MLPGTRVVRGPDWQWEDQDGGEGHVGTVVRPGMAERNAVVQRGTVFVQWDTGQLANYRVGGQTGAFDLLVLDAGPAGGIDGQFACDECLKSDIVGRRWTCLECTAYSLCDSCYGNDTHDVTHTFLRFTTPQAVDGDPVPARVNSRKVTAMGLYPGATVERGPDWKWSDQDGGPGNCGTVQKIIHNRGNATPRSVCRVTWVTGTRNEYRIGHVGRVDLVAVIPASGGPYYPEHLPKLDSSLLPGVAGMGSENPEATAAADSQVEEGLGHFSEGDRVQANLEADIFEALQEGHGGWIASMAKCVGRQGTVIIRFPTGDLRVQFDGLPQQYTINPAVLSRAAAKLKKGDMVSITTDQDRLMALQEGHGGWNNTMMLVLGATTKVRKIDSDGDVVVKVLGSRICLNPLACTLVDKTEKDGLSEQSSESESEEDSDGGEQIQARRGGLQHLTQRLAGGDLDLAAHLAGLAGDGSDLTAHLARAGLAGEDTGLAARLAALRGKGAGVISGPGVIVAAAAVNDKSTVRAILARDPQQVDHRHESRTALQVAALKGHAEMVRLLLEAGADVMAQDDDGDNPVHFAVIENRADVLDLLMKYGADVNLVNYKLQTPLHIAVHNQHIQCVRVLLKHGCLLQCANLHGDTALNDAVRLSNYDILALLTAPDNAFNYAAKNENGFNALQYAVYAGNSRAAEMILARVPPGLVDDQKSDGFTALHIAALNGQRAIVDVLVKKGGANMDVWNAKGDTPLLLATLQSKISTIELLVNLGCNVNVGNIYTGNTCLHMVIAKLGERGGAAVKSSDLESAADIMQVQKDLPPAFAGKTWLACALFLVKRGADMMQKNLNGQTPLDLTSSGSVHDLLLEALKGAATVPKPFKSIPAQATLEKSKPFQFAAAAPPSSDKPFLFNATSPVAKPARNTAEEIEKLSDCQMCSDALANIRFEPCGHCVACADCAQRMKKCFFCKAAILEKRLIQEHRATSHSLIELRELKQLVYQRSG